jgi:Tfp pilus assembly protein PilW
MRITIDQGRQMGRAGGFTLGEAMIASSVLMLIVMALISFNMWGLSMAARSQIWLSASDDARNAMRMLHQDVRTAYSVQVGSGMSNGGGASNGFIPVSGTNAWTGNALFVVPSTNVYGWVEYYYDTNSNMLCRTNYDGTNTGDFNLVSANPITNDNPIFSIVELLGSTINSGNVMAYNNTNPWPMVSVYLSFTKLQIPEVVIAPGNPVDFYQINTKISMRQRP